MVVPLSGIQLKSFLSDRLNLVCDEFNAEAVAGLTTVARLKKMLDEASFAFLVMTAEDTHADDTAHARENVIHEARLFQGRLGFERVIILLEEGCTQFSNIHGLTNIGFPKGNLEPAFERIRGVLEREHEGRAVPDKVITDHHVRPDITLRCIPVSDRKLSRSVAWQTGGTPDAYNFRVTNKGPGQIVNVSIEPLILPISADTIAQNTEVERAFFDGTAQGNSSPDPASNRWTVVFEEIGSVPVGEEATIPFQIENTGALQRTDLHHCLSRTSRAESFAPLLLPLHLRFYNLDGATWLQTYELSHELAGNITLAFRRVSRVRGEG